MSVIQNTIPIITHELGKYWKQPELHEIIFKDDKAFMSLKALNKLGEYNCSLPSGVYVGKMWKRKRLRFFNAYYLLWYDHEKGEDMVIEKREIHIK